MGRMDPARERSRVVRGIVGVLHDSCSLRSKSHSIQWQVAGCPLGSASRRLHAQEEGGLQGLLPGQGLELHEESRVSIIIGYSQIIFSDFHTTRGSGSQLQVDHGGVLSVHEWFGW